MRERQTETGTITRACGHREEFRAHGPLKVRQALIRLESGNLCASCGQRVLKDAFSGDWTMPELTGAPRQVRAAERIRGVRAFRPWSSSSKQRRGGTRVARLLFHRSV